MMDDLSPLAVVGMMVVVVIVLSIFIIKSEDADIARFHARCMAAGETSAKCDILSEIKRSSDDTGMMAAGSMGYAAGRGR